MTWRISLWVIVLLGMLGLEPLSYAATVPAGSGQIRMEMVVVLPQKGHLAVFQQVDLPQGGGVATIGVPFGASGVTAMGATLLRQSASAVVLKNPQAKLALRYNVPWNGQSLDLVLPAYAAVQSLVFLVPSQLTVPSVLNPALSPNGKGKIPGIANSPVFREYATSNVAQGQGFRVVLEKSGVKSSGGSALFANSGSYPALGSVFQGLLVLLAAGAVILAFNWRPAYRFSRNPLIRRQLLHELALLDASFGRGELNQAAYDTRRRELMGELQSVWDSPRQAGG